MNEQRKTTKTNDKSAWINGICIVIAAAIGLFSINIDIEYDKLGKNYEELQLENSKLKEQIIELQESYNDLDINYLNLKNENTDLQNQILSLIDENELLQTEILKLDNETPNNSNPILENSNKKVTIFDLDTFKGEVYWYNHSSYNFSEKDFIDTYENEYLTAHLAYHKATDIANPSNPIYLLDNKYSMCQGQIAWSKTDKNKNGSVWIDFYSGDELIYSTNPLTADDRAMSFEFNVKNIEKLTVVMNSSTDTGILIIYPYFDFIE